MKRFRWGAAITAVLVVVGAGSAITAAPPSHAAAPVTVVTPNYSQIIANEAYWISLSQVPTTVSGPGRGGLAWYPDSGTRKIRPYIANRGAVGMLLGGSRYYPMVLAYVDWYFRHVNGGPSSPLPADRSGLSGTVYDWDVNVATGAETYGADPITGTTPWYDSSDAYAGTFLTLVRQLAQDDPASDSYLKSKAPDLLMIAKAAVATMQTNNDLTDAKPGSTAQYLMDNVEVDAGLKDYAWVLTHVLGDSADSTTWATTSNQMAAAINTNLWNSSTGMYCWAADQCANTNWGEFYPSSVAQLWPIKAGIAAPARAGQLWTNFESNWADCNTSANCGTEPWSVIALDAADVGDTNAANTYIDSAESIWINTGRAWPWNIADSADLAGAASILQG